MIEGLKYVLHVDEEHDRRNRRSLRTPTINTYQWPYFAIECESHSSIAHEAYEPIDQLRWEP